MTFGYVGYIWALIGCSFVLLFLGGVGLTLHLIGKRMDKSHAPKTTVESIPLTPKTSPKDSA